jgi:hypothetical protein
VEIWLRAQSIESAANWFCILAFITETKTPSGQNGSLWKKEGVQKRPCFATTEGATKVKTDFFTSHSLIIHWDRHSQAEDVENGRFSRQ